MSIDNTMTHRTAALCIALLLGIGPAWADTPPLEGARPGSGWRQDSAGQWRGTGENFGQGWRMTPDGQWRGTGENFGRGWRRDSAGQWRGTGENVGQGWAPRGR
jgi:hypothetical protein